MKKIHYQVGLLLALILPLIIFTIHVNTKTRQVTHTQAQQIPTQTTVLAKNLEVPWALGFLPDGNILFTERTGKVKLLNKTSSAVTVIATIPVKAQAESGLLGLAIHPQFATNHFIYLYYSYAATSGIQNRVARYTLINNQLSAATTLIDAIPGNDYHNGGRMRFGPDGYLYITTGDGNNTANPQNTNSLGGKILRVKDDGTAAPGNPFNNRVWSYGHRNPQGIAWDGNVMYATEHGPSSPSCCDEINKIEAGKNYGWPDVKGDELKDGTVKNLLNSGQDPGQTWAPSGTAFYNGSLFFAGLKGQALYEAKPGQDTATIVNQHYKNQLGRIRDVVVGPDNMLYIATSNKSSQGGDAQPEDDKILRVEFPNVATPNPTLPQPTGVTPTLYCLSGAPCTTPDPTTAAMTPPVNGTSPTTNPSTTGTVNPNTTPSPTVSPCETQSSVQHYKHKKHKKHRHGGSGGGFLSKFFEFLIKILEMLFKLFGGAVPNNPNPVDPSPTPTIEPTPCPEPTSEEPTVEPTPQPSTDPTVNPSVTVPAGSITPAAGTVLWRGDPAAGRNQWATEHTVNAARITIETVAGRQAWRMQVNDGDNFSGERTELGQDDNEERDFNNGDDVWVGYAIYLPVGFPTNAKWTALTQWKDQDPDLGSPSWETDCEGGLIGLNGELANGWAFSRPCTTGVWHNFVVHHKLSNTSSGLVEAWYSTGDTQPVKVVSRSQQTYRTSAKMVPRMGYYRDPAITGNHFVYHANWAVGTSFDAVNPVK